MTQVWSSVPSTSTRCVRNSPATSSTARRSVTTSTGPGKREALLAANAPIAKTLRPCREESVDFDTTKNLFIEGDNLDALKLLQETYLNKVKMIYIDPPYNTGKQMIYRDSYKFVLVQFPEEILPEKKEQKAAYDFCKQHGLPTLLTEIGKERIRRAGKKIKEEHATTAPDLDIGFRVLKVDTSNMNEVYYTPDKVVQDDLFSMTDNIKADRSHEDLLFQVLLDWGVDLTLPITRETIEGKTVYFVDENALAACFETGISEPLVKALAKRKPLRAVFRDAGFADDSMKINVEQIFKLLSPETEVKSI